VKPTNKAEHSAAEQSTAELFAAEPVWNDDLKIAPYSFAPDRIGTAYSPDLRQSTVYKSTVYSSMRRGGRASRPQPRIRSSVRLNMRSHQEVYGWTPSTLEHWAAIPLRLIVGATHVERRTDPLNAVRGAVHSYSTETISLLKPRRTLFRLRASCWIWTRLTRVANAQKMAFISSLAKCRPTHI
jgi:hypothetical protein